MKKKLTAVLSVLLTFAILMTACGSKEVPETTAAATTAATTVPETAAPQPLTLTNWNMRASTWSSPNGATIHITANPDFYEEGQKADFVVRLENEDIALAPCQWDGSSYTASIDLNAANGYCYYVILTAADGTTSEVAVNIPAEPTNMEFINLEASLQTSCHLFVQESTIEDGVLTLSSGKAEIRPPLISSENQDIICQDAVLILNTQEKEISRTSLGIPAVNENGIYEIPLSGITFKVPETDEDLDLSLLLNVTLSNGQVLSSLGARWVYHEEAFLPVVG